MKYLILMILFVGVISCKNDKEGTMKESYYNFAFGDKNAGIYILKEKPGYIYQNARFLMEGNEFENPFELEYEGDSVTRLKLAGGDWGEFKFPADHYPTSAFLLLLPKVESSFKYIAVNEGESTILGETVLTKEGNKITESRNGETIREFWMEEGNLVKINWGGPVSTLQSSLEEALEGSELKLPNP